MATTGPLIVSVSGVRGVVGESLTPQVALAFACDTSRIAVIPVASRFSSWNGSGANDFTSMRLGPASFSKTVSAWASASPADGDLAKTGAGQLFLSLRARYVMPFFCG